MEWDLTHLFLSPSASIRISFLFFFFFSSRKRKRSNQGLHGWQLNSPLSWFNLTDTNRISRSNWLHFRLEIAYHSLIMKGYSQRTIISCTEVGLQSSGPIRSRDPGWKSSCSQLCRSNVGFPPWTVNWLPRVISSRHTTAMTNNLSKVVNCGTHLNTRSYRMMSRMRKSEEL